MAFWDTTAEAVCVCVCVCEMDGHNFGLVTAVLSFKRISHVISQAARRLFGLWIAAYFDDYCICEPYALGMSGKSALRHLHERCPVSHSPRE